MLLVRIMDCVRTDSEEAALKRMTDKQRAERAEHQAKLAVLAKMLAEQSGITDDQAIVVTRMVNDLVCHTQKIMLSKGPEDAVKDAQHIGISCIVQALVGFLGKSSQAADQILNSSLKEVQDYMDVAGPGPKDIPGEVAELLERVLGGRSKQKLLN